MTLQEYYALRMLISIALGSKEFKNNAVMYDKSTGLSYPVAQIIDIASDYIYDNFDIEVMKKFSL